jgi:beta-lactamase regulating signal transducer with metallopeptidase domain
MRKYLIALVATFAVVAALIIPHRGNSDAVKWTASSPSVLSRSLGEHRSTESQKLQITPIQANVSVVGLAFGH